MSLLLHESPSLPRRDVPVEPAAPIIVGALTAGLVVLVAFDSGGYWESTREALAIAALWALAGVTVLPASPGRTDVHGLVWLPIFAYALLLSPRKAFFAALFIATSDIEIVGTILGNWSWALQIPWLHVTSGNPPSAIAGGYAVIDGSMLVVSAGLQRISTFLLPRRALTYPAAW